MNTKRQIEWWESLLLLYNIELSLLASLAIYQYFSFANGSFCGTPDIENVCLALDRAWLLLLGGIVSLFVSRFSGSTLVVRSSAGCAGLLLAWPTLVLLRLGLTDPSISIYQTSVPLQVMLGLIIVGSFVPRITISTTGREIVLLSSCVAVLYCFLTSLDSSSPWWGVGANF